MTRAPKPAHRIRETIPADQVKRAVNELVAWVEKAVRAGADNVALIGIHTRGAILAERISAALSEKGIEISVGAIDITLYRDDLSTSGIQPEVGESQIDFDLDEKEIILIDDVLFTGRTIRAAMDELMDFGRPRQIRLAVLIDRGHRELPIQADFAAIKVTTQRSDFVDLHLGESDGADQIVVSEPSL